MKTRRTAMATAHSSNSLARKFDALHHFCLLVSSQVSRYCIILHSYKTDNLELLPPSFNFFNDSNHPLDYDPFYSGVHRLIELS